MTDRDRGSYHNMSASQKALFDYTEEAGMYGGKRKVDYYGKGRNKFTTKSKKR